MSEAPPLAFQWDGEAMVPRHPRLADRHYVVGETYTLEERQDRSMRSHNHYFSCLQEAFDNLPEDLADRFPSPEALRKYCLIRAGYRDERSIACSSKAEAQRVGAFVKPMDSFAVVAIRDAVVVVYTAKSQSVKAMGKADFAASKDAVLTILAQMIGTSKPALEQNAEERAA